MRNAFIVLAIAITFGIAIYFISSGQGPDDDGNPVAAEAGAEPGAVSNNNSDQPLRSQAFGYEQFIKLIGSLDKTQRDAVLTDKELLARVVSQETQRLSFIDAAQASQFAKNEKIQYLLERQADNFLVTNYIKDRLQAAGVPDGFPSEDQIAQFYEKNKQRFSIGERMPVWQVFWTLPEGTSKSDIAKSFKQASSVSSKLRKGKLTFAQAATQYSQHAASSLQGGFMGVLKTADLRPQIKEALITLKQSNISKPVRSNNGLHVFRRGAALPAETFSLDRVRPQVVEALMQTLRAQQRAQLNKLVQTQYPARFDAEEIAEWAGKAASYYN